MHLRNALIRKIAGDRLVDKLDRRYNTMYTNAPRGKPVSPKVQKARSMKPIMHEPRAKPAGTVVGLGKDVLGALSSSCRQPSRREQANRRQARLWRPRLQTWRGMCAI